MTSRTISPLHDKLEAAGARFGDADGYSIPRHFGDAASEYETLAGGVGLTWRGDRSVIRMWGRDPVRMLQGLITNDLATAPAGKAVYGAVLTAKGRMVADLRIVRRETGEGIETLFDAAREALPGLREHLQRFVPPMFARWEVADEAFTLLGLYGPEAPRAAREVLGEATASLGEDEVVAIDGPEGAFAIGTGYAGEGGIDILVPADRAPDLWDRLTAAGARPVGFSAVETRRIERGHPRYGTDMSADNIATEVFQETGQMERAISFSKGCYTGQEVIVRIAHRGRVNRRLTGLLLGDAPTPPHGAELSHPETGKAMGWVTSAADSPRLAQIIALAYVRREREPGDTVLIDGREATVAALPFQTP